MAHDSLPNFISVKYKSNCKGGETLADRGRCDNVPIGHKVSNITILDKARNILYKSTWGYFEERVMIRKIEKGF